MTRILLSCILIVMLFSTCKEEVKAPPPLFKVLDNKKTGLDFSNDLSYSKEFNLFKYIYFYNGSGVGAGDFNNDGLIDLFFGSNQGDNKLYLNEGKIHFKDVTAEAKIPEDHGWTTGISVIDINNDGMLDIYVCRVGSYETLKSKNQFLICTGIDKNGVPQYIDKAAEYGLDFSGFSTQAAFFDYDMDGDIDMFLLNHSVHENGTFKPRKDFLGTAHPISGDRFFRNDDAKFTDVTKETGINSSAIGYGLGIAVADINLDGYPDIYIGNDFHEDDYLYINQKNGTFKEQGREQLMHTSQFSMGVDVADVNNDAYPDIISVDMLPSDPVILKRSLGEDAYDIFNYKVSVGYSYQYTRNNFQLNRRNGMFSEVGLLSGIAATDWSWAPLWVDFDNDGYKDLFVSNGIPKRMNDIDYVNFVSNGEVQQNIRLNNIEKKDMALINKFPEIKLPDKFYRNNGDLTFTDAAEFIEDGRPTFSNGAAYADLDNDGDLDIIVNNIDGPALIYENKTAVDKERSSRRLNLKGPSNNRNAIGTRIITYSGNEIRTYEKFPVKGFMSSMEVPVIIGLKKTKVDSMILIWPDNTCISIKDSIQSDFTYQPGLPLFNYEALRTHYVNPLKKMVDITSATGIDFTHKENHFVEFDREPLIPHMMSTEGPALAVNDINKDGLDDVFIGSARYQKSCIYLQQPSGQFIKTKQPVFDADTVYEDTDAVWADVNNDGNMDLLVASGGNEFYGKDYHNTPRVYINDGKTNFTKLEGAFANLYLTASCIAAHDVNGDGYVDLFIGARAVPWEYGKVPQSYLLLNDKTGKFKDVTANYAEGLSNVGMVTNAKWFDLDKDGDKDLLLSLEWGRLCAFMNNKGTLQKKDITDKSGWWNFMLPFDADNDGNIDLIAGNLGLNSRLKASEKEPARLYYNDFDGNDKKEQVLTYYLSGKQIPFPNKAELDKQLPVLKKKFLYAKDFGNATLADLFTAEKLDKAQVLTADYFSNSILLNKQTSFETKPLPIQAQFTSYKDAVVVDANGDELLDILIVGNYYDNNIQMGRYDADFGTILVNKGGGNFACQSINGLTIKGQVRHIKPITIKGKPAFILVRNNDSAMIIQFTD